MEGFPRGDLVEPDACAEEGDAALDEVLEDVGHGEVGDVGVGVLEPADGLDVLHDGGGDGDHVSVSEQRALGHAGGSAGVADHAEVVGGGFGGGEARSVGLEGVDEVPEGEEGDVVLLRGGAKLVGERADLEGRREREADDHERGERAEALRVGVEAVEKHEAGGGRAENRFQFGLAYNGTGCERY